MSDGFVRDDDDCFAPLNDECHTAGNIRAAEPNDGETWILHPVAESPRRLRHPRLGIASKIWCYMADSENMWDLNCRFDKPNGKKEFAPYSFWLRADGTEHGRWKCPPGPRPLYKLPDVVARADARVMICEGEKATDDAALVFPDHITTCWQGGANAGGHTDYSPLAGRHVTIWPDNDKPGRAAASGLIPPLFDLGCQVDVIDAERLSATVPDRPDETRPPIDKWDAADAMAEWSDHDALRQVVSLYTAAAKAPPAYRSYGRFTMDESGLYAAPRSKKDGDQPTQVSGPFELIGRARSSKGGRWGRLARWCDGDDRSHTHLILDADLQGNLLQITAPLADDGLKIVRGRAGDFADYVNGCVDPPKVLIADRPGWLELPDKWIFVLPGTSFGDAGGQQVILIGTSTANFATAGSLDDWVQGVGTLTRGHSRQMLMVSAAFASVVLSPLGREGCGLSLYGHSSTGKTTAIASAASVWGKGTVGGFAITWCGTPNGIEARAQAHSDLPLIVDEFGQADGNEIGNLIYRLSSGVGKARATKEGTSQPSQIRRVMVLSTGELSLRDKLREAGKAAMAGQLVRLLGVPADPGLGFGAFDHGGASGDAKDLADALKHAARTHYGTAGPEFVRRLIEKGVAEVVSEAEAAITAFARDHVPSGADGQVRRAADTFAMVGYAGELATALGVLPWQPGEALGAAVTCFEAWLDDRGGAGSHEVPEAIERIRSFIERHGTSRFETFPTSGRQASSVVVADRAGYRRGEGAETEWLIFPKVWKNEVLRELDTGTTRRALLERGLLRANDKHQCMVKVSGTSERFYAVRLGAAGADDREDAEPLLI